MDFNVTGMGQPAMNTQPINFLASREIHKEKKKRKGKQAKQDNRMSHFLKDPCHSRFDPFFLFYFLLSYFSNIFRLASIYSFSRSAKVLTGLSITDSFFVFISCGRFKTLIYVYERCFIRVHLYKHNF